MKNYGLLEKFVPLLAPADIATSATATPYVDLKDVLDCTFEVILGVVTATSADQTIAITVEASSAAASNATEAAIAFSYRLSGAIGTDTMGAITAATSAGYTLAETNDSKLILVQVDPAAVQGAVSNLNGRFVRLVVTPGTGVSAVFVSVIAVLKPRHAAVTMVSSS
jgi:hypothetical protein